MLDEQRTEVVEERWAHGLVHRGDGVEQRRDRAQRLAAHRTGHGSSISPRW